MLRQIPLAEGTSKGRLCCEPSIAMLLAARGMRRELGGAHSGVHFIHYEDPGNLSKYLS